MKKFLVLLSAAALVLVSCAKVKDVYTGSPESRQIAFSPLAQPATKAPIADGVFPTSSTMKVAAYNQSAGVEFFAPADFTYSNSGTLWTGGKSWPLSPAVIHFLAYAEFQGETATWGTPSASSVALQMTDNSSAQKDLVYAIGTGTVSQENNALEFPVSVAMSFQHAQAWIAFNANAASGSGGRVKVNYIKLNGAKYSGTFTVTMNSYNTASPSVSGAWSALGDAPAAGVSIAGPDSAIATTEGGTAIGSGLLIVPDPESESDFTSFTINYTLDGKTYNYTYTPESLNVLAGYKYTYNIVFSMHDIAISAGVQTWSPGSGVNVNI